MIRSAYSPAARLDECFAGRGEEPRFPFLGTVRDGDRVAAEFERTSAFEGEPWVGRQAHTMDVNPDGLREHHIYCCGPRRGTPDLAAVHEEARS